MVGSRSRKESGAGFKSYLGAEKPCISKIKFGPRYEGIKNFCAVLVRQGACVVGLKDKLKKYNEEHKDDGFQPLELTEANVQAIFNRCLATFESKERIPVVLFPVMFGYKPEDEILIQFDKQILLKNIKNIDYLYGQLNEVHKIGSAHSKQRKGMSIEDFLTLYTGSTWTTDKGSLLKFLYLGCNDEHNLIKPFNKKYNGTDMSMNIKPTLSPRDPNFPAWWEAHKGEWEDKA